MKAKNFLPFLRCNHSVNYTLQQYLSYITIATNISLGVFVAIAFVVPISYSSAPIYLSYKRLAICRQCYCWFVRYQLPFMRQQFHKLLMTDLFHIRHSGDNVIQILPWIHITVPSSTPASGRRQTERTPPILGE